MFTELEESGGKAETPVSEVLRLWWRRLLIAGGVRVGSDVFYALVYVFTLTYVTTVLNLSRTVALTAIMIATPFSWRWYLHLLSSPWSTQPNPG